MEVLAQDLRVMDASAIALMRDNDIPIVVFSIRERGNLLRVVQGRGRPHHHHGAAQKRPERRGRCHGDGEKPDLGEIPRPDGQGGRGAEGGVRLPAHRPRLASLLDQVQVEAYGSKMPINQVGAVSVPEPRSITVSVWDKALVVSVEKAIRNAGLGLNPVVEGQNLRIPIPPLTEERRKDLAKLAGKYAEQQRVAVRNVRRDAMDDLKKAEKDAVISQDEHKRLEARGPEAHRRGRPPRGRGLENQRTRDHAGLSARASTSGAREEISAMSRPIALASACCDRIRPTPGASALHVAIIMDGNGRWAKQRGLPRALGHRAGVAALRRTVEGAEALGVERLTVFGFSTENWSRPQHEVSEILGLMKAYFASDLARLERERRQGAHRRPPRRASSPTSWPSSRRPRRAPPPTTASICRSPSTMAAAPTSPTRRASSPRLVAEGQAQPGRPRRGSCSRAGSPPRRRAAPDLIIRTGYERRLSNFLLWECAYAELIFQDVYWPDYGPEHLKAAIAEFQSRERRFGRVAVDDVLAAG